MNGLHHPNSDWRGTNWYARRWAFSLIELLVVIGIVAVLVGLLLGAISMARTQAVVAACLSNQRQLGQGVESYVAAYRQMPGMSKDPNFGLGHGEWGTEPCRGAEITQWDRYYAGLPHPKTGELLTGPVGIGYVYPFIYGAGGYTDTADGRASDGRILFCPGTSVSFESRPFGPGGKYANAWLHHGSTFGFGQEGRRASGTYVWRGGAYPLDASLPEDDPAWQANWSFSVVRPDNPILSGKSMLTCHYYASSHPVDGYTFDRSLAPHRGRTANLLRSDGSAKSWRLPSGIVPFSADYDAQVRRAANFYTSPTVIASTTEGERLVKHCAPWWWVKADHFGDH